jgi:O-antigen ligase
MATPFLSVDSNIPLERQERGQGFLTFRENSKDAEAVLWIILVIADAWPMIKKNPIVGRGLGSFQWTYPAYERVEPDKPAKYAHGDYVQAVAETGVVGLVLLLWAAGSLWKSALKNLRSKDPLVGGIGLATIGVLTAIALQEVTDFGLYIPGIAVMASVIAGLNLRMRLEGSKTPSLKGG